MTFPGTSAARWLKLADEQAEQVTYLENRGEFAGVARNREKLYRRTVESIQLETETGKPHCVCCLKPVGRIHR